MEEPAAEAALDEKEDIKPDDKTESKAQDQGAQDDLRENEDNEQNVNIVIDLEVPKPDEKRTGEDNWFVSEPRQETIRPPDYTAAMSIPRTCLTAYHAYQLSEETLNLLSEATRSTFPDLFVKDKRLGLLSELCVRALAKHNLPLELVPNWSAHPQYIEIYFEEVPLGMTIEKSLPIESDIYWKRLVLERHHDKSLSLKENVQWKNVGISLLLAEKVEDNAVEYWVNEEMAELAEKISDFVTELTLTKLKSQSDATFDRYYENAENESYASSEDSDDDFVDEEEAAKGYDGSLNLDSAEFEEEIEVEEFDEEEDNQNFEQIAIEDEPIPPPPPPKKKKKKKKKGLSIIDIEVEESDSAKLEAELEAEKCDGRNMEKYLNKIRNFNYPTKLCHHIDLSFIKYFEQIEEFNLAFSGDGHTFDYHEKHLKFSYRDMYNLGEGLRYLPRLRIFRFTKSRMDKKKLKIVIKGLMSAPFLEVVDFKLDHLKDNCGRWFYELISNSTTLRYLELESNELSTNVMRWIGSAFHKHEGSIIEYLGLARNPIGDSGLRHLFKGLVGTRHVQHLNLTGISCSANGVMIVAEELIAKHQYLKRLILTAIQISPPAADVLVNTLIHCLNLIEIDVRCCNLDYDTELDIAIIQKRNRIMSENTIDPNKTMEEIEDWLKRVKHPLLLRVIAEIHIQLECLENKPPEFEVTEKSISDTLSEDVAQSEHSLIDDDVANLCVDSETSSFHFPILPKHDRLSMNYGELTEEQYVHYATMGGPENRYHYHQAIKKRHAKVARRRRVEDTDQFQRQSLD